MTRTQIQLPDPLYREIKRLAQEQDWSIAEVLRRGAEAILRAYPFPNPDISYLSVCSLAKADEDCVVVEF